MKNLTKKILFAGFLLFCGTFLFIGIRTLNSADKNAGTVESHNILKTAIVIGDSPYVLSSLYVSKKEYRLIVTGKVSQNPPAMDVLPVITYGKKSKIGSVEPDGSAYSHQNDDFALEYVYKNPSSKAEWLTVTFTYNDASGNAVQFVTPKIELNR